MVAAGRNRSPGLCVVVPTEAVGIPVEVSKTHGHKGRIKRRRKGRKRNPFQCSSLNTLDNSCDRECCTLVGQFNILKRKLLIPLPTTLADNNRMACSLFFNKKQKNRKSYTTHDPNLFATFWITKQSQRAVVVYLMSTTCIVLVCHSA